MDICIETILTGHMHRNSPYETSSDCGNCDGARCDYFTKLYEVTDFDSGKYHGRYDTLEEAKKKKEELERT